MAHEVSSAKPEELFEYAKRGSWITFHLDMESSVLAERLQRFENLCTEPAYRVPTNRLANHLQNFSDECKPIDDWVERIGKEFLEADQSNRFTTIPSINMCVDDNNTTSLEFLNNKEWENDLEDEDIQVLLKDISELKTKADLLGLVDKIENVPKYRVFMGKLIKYQKEVRGARKLSQVAPDYGLVSILGISIKQLESIAEYSVGDKQNEPIERLFEELILNVPIYIGADLSGDLAGTYLGALGLSCGPLAPACVPIFYVGGNYVVGGVLVEGALDWIRDVYLDIKFAVPPKQYENAPTPLPVPTPSPPMLKSEAEFKVVVEQWNEIYLSYKDGTVTWQQCIQELQPLLNQDDPPRIEGMVLIDGTPQWAGIYYKNGQWIQVEEPTFGQAKK